MTNNLPLLKIIIDDPTLTTHGELPTSFRTLEPGTVTLNCFLFCSYTFAKPKNEFNVYH